MKKVRDKQGYMGKLFLEIEQIAKLGYDIELIYVKRKG